MKGVGILVFFTTFILFVSEAIIHYNIGNPSSKIQWPSGKELGLIMGTVAVFYLLNSFFVWGLEKIFSAE